MKDYKGFTAKQRLANLKAVKEAIKNGSLSDPKTIPCEICGINEGVREWHCEDYSEENAMKSLHCYCWRCHRNYHILQLGIDNKRYETAKKYFEEVNKGKKFNPVYTKYYTKEMEQGK